MGNQESISGSNVVLKKKIKKKVPQQKQSQKKIIKKQSYQQPNIENNRINQNQSNIRNGDYYEESRSNQTRNIYSIPKKHEYNDFSNFNYEVRTKNTDISNSLVERSMIQNKKMDVMNEHFMDRPTNSNHILSNPKPNFDNIVFNPDSFQDQVKEYKNHITQEEQLFEENIEIKKKKFYETQKMKQDKLERSIIEFEKNYDPWDILGLEKGDLDLNNIKKAYKRNALKYHPDKAGKKYENVFNIINQSYIYLLNKSEQENELEIKSTREVTKQKYENFGDGMVNMHLDKDNFNINKFNEIFDKFRMNDENDEGYTDLLKSEEGDSQPLFNSKVSNEIFNSHFNKLKDKKSEALIEYEEPQYLNSSGSLGLSELGGQYQDGFGHSDSLNLGYTDIKKAHYEENLLINPEQVKYKKYNSIDQLESERSKISYKPSEEDKVKYIKIENKKKKREKDRIELLRERDEMLKKNYYTINKKLIK